MCLCVVVCIHDHVCTHSKVAEEDCTGCISCSLPLCCCRLVFAIHVCLQGSCCITTGRCCYAG